MLYKMRITDDRVKDLEALPFLDFAALGKIEKDLEALLATHLLDVLFEDAALMPIFQERSRQAEADLYALNRTGNLVIFELKRGLAGSDAMLQALRYAQDAGRWTFNALQEKYRTYCGDNSASLANVHREAFYLERPLQPSDFNTRQRFVIVGNAANDSLISAVDYWKQQGLTVEFLPYRVYSIGEQHYFEFFALPYDRHQNPSSVKGVLFDTNCTWYEDAIWEMMEKKRVAAYGDSKHFVDYLNSRDIVFFSHKLVGIVAAAEVIGPARDDGPQQRYRDVKFLTPVPAKGTGIAKFMPFSQVTNFTGKGFFWARTIKVPYLSREEARLLLAELKKILG
jgi:hypothetical protein